MPAWPRRRCAGTRHRASSLTRRGERTGTASTTRSTWLASGSSCRSGASASDRRTRAAWLACASSGARSTRTFCRCSPRSALPWHASVPISIESRASSWISSSPSRPPGAPPGGDDRCPLMRFASCSCAPTTRHAARSPRPCWVTTAAQTSRCGRPGTVVTQVNPRAIAALGELGIDWSGRRSKSITEFLDQQFDYVITVCDRARATCPVFPGSSNTLHWGLDDPSEVEGTDEEQAEAFRRTATEISARLRPFIEVALRAAGRPQRSVILG